MLAHVKKNVITAKLRTHTKDESARPPQMEAVQEERHFMRDMLIRLRDDSICNDSDLEYCGQCASTESLSQTSYAFGCLLIVDLYGCDADEIRHPNSGSICEAPHCVIRGNRDLGCYCVRWDAVGCLVLAQQLSRSEDEA
ncbi:hypothetical protein TNCV_2430431 [Trichonephila clavipes]|nr:hypothetical protein TNCV_2430431 [Trichonephila clavipes]